MGIPAPNVYGLDVARLSSAVPACVRCDRYNGEPGAPDEMTGLPQRIDRPVAVAPHWHEFYEIGVVVDGRAQHITEAGSSPLTKGSVVIVPRGAVHGYESIEEMTLLNLFYIGEWLAADLPELWRDPLMVHLFLAGALFETQHHVHPSAITLSNDALRRVKWELIDLGEKLAENASSTSYTRACMMKALFLLAEAHDQRLAKTARAAFRPEVWFVLQEVELRLSTGDPLVVAALAHACDLSPEHLSRLFHEAVGQTVMQYYQKRRAQRACRLLSRPDASVTDLVHDLGFSDYAHFRRQFEKYIGMSPKAYRERARHGSVN